MVKTTTTPQPISEVEKAVEAIHQPEKPTESQVAPTVEISTETKKGRGAAASKKAETTVAEPPKPAVLEKEKQRGKRGRPVLPKDEDIVRVSVDLPKSLYKRVKMKVVHEEITLFEYFAQLAERDLAG